MTQVLTPFDNEFLLHNRLTHSEKVADVAVSVARHLRETTDSSVLESLGGLDIDVVDAAALAHDLGHPPFGHVGEETLDQIARLELNLREGFEGNAQTFRILTKLSRRDPRYDGLALTDATLVATAKYPWKRAVQSERHDELVETDLEYARRWRKFSVYDADIEELVRAQEFLPEIYFPRGLDKLASTQSVEASIMDIADDITYAIHDLEDFYLAGVLEPRTVVAELRSWTPTHKGAPNQTVFNALQNRLMRDYPDYFLEDDFENAVDNVSTLLGHHFHGVFGGSPDDEATVHRACSKRIGEYVGSVSLSLEPAWAGGPYVALPRPQWHAVQILKEITRHFIIRRPDLALEQRSQQLVLKQLVGMLQQWAQSKSDYGRLPARLRDELEIARLQGDGTSAIGARGPDHPRRGSEDRAIIDYICTLTDNYCVTLFQSLAGIKVARFGLRSFA